MSSARATVSESPAIEEYVEEGADDGEFTVWPVCEVALTNQDTCAPHGMGGKAAVNDEPPLATRGMVVAPPPMSYVSVGVAGSSEPGISSVITTGTDPPDGSMVSGSPCARATDSSGGPKRSTKRPDSMSLPMIVPLGKPTKQLHSPLKEALLELGAVSKKPTSGGEFRLWFRSKARIPEV